MHTNRLAKYLQVWKAIVKLPADMNNVSEDEVTFCNIIRPECVLVKIDRDIFNIV